MPPFIAAQVVGGVVGLALILALYPDAQDRADAAEHAVAADLTPPRPLDQDAPVDQLEETP